jgi:ribosome biogenesis protein MAK21
MGSKRTKERKTADKPSLDETTLAQLTSKIDKSLANSEKQRAPKRKRQRDNDDEDEPKKRQTRPSDRSSERDRKDGPKNKQAPRLLDEIFALGGDEHDLELVANVDSGDEGGNASRPKPEPETVVDKSLQDELMQFASSLGFSKFRQDEDPETDEDIDAAESVADGSSDITQEESKAPEEHSQVAPPPQETRQGKQSRKLVSKQSCNMFSLLGRSADLTPYRDSSLVLTGTASHWRAYLHRPRATSSIIPHP